MRIVVGILCSSLWIMYAGQLISVVNFGLAQRLGLQENPNNTDPLSSGLEMWAARWDLVWFWTLPTAGILMLMDHAWWPYAAMIGGGAYVDTGGREAAKVLGLKEQGVRTGSPAENRLNTVVFTSFVVIGLLAIVTGLLQVI